MKYRWKKGGRTTSMKKNITFLVESMDTYITHIRTVESKLRPCDGQIDSG